MTRKRWITYGLGLALCIVSVVLTLLFNHDGYYFAMIAVILSLILTRIHRKSITDEREYQMILKIDNLALGILLVVLFVAGAMTREYLATGRAGFITFIADHFVVLTLATLLGAESLIGIVLFRKG